MARLTIFENELTKTPEKQFQQINLALQSVNEWGKRINTNSIVHIKDDNASSTSSTSYQQINGYSTSFNNTNPLIRIDVSICLNANANTADLRLFLDKEEVGTSRVSVNGIAMHNFFFQGKLYTGNHTLELQWKTSAGTINKIQGGSQMIVTNLV